MTIYQKLHQPIRLRTNPHITGLFLIALLILCGGIAFQLSVYVHTKPPTNPITISQGTNNPLSQTGTNTGQPVPTTPQPAPAPAPAPKTVTPPAPTPQPAAPVVVPTPTSEVPSLTPSSGSTSSTAKSYTSTNWSGYFAANPSITFTAITGSWTVPAATGTSGSTATDAAWIGLGGITTTDLIQVGTSDNVASNGTQTVTAFYELLPKAAVTIPALLINPGNVVQARISKLSNSFWSITITNTTLHLTFTKTVNYAATGSSAEWIEEDPGYKNGTLVPLDNFGSIAFTNGAATVNSTSTTIAGLQPSSITLVTNTGQPIATPSALSSDGTGFSVHQN